MQTRLLCEHCYGVRKITSLTLKSALLTSDLFDFHSIVPVLQNGIIQRVFDGLILSKKVRNSCRFMIQHLKTIITDKIILQNFIIKSRFFNIPIKSQ